MKKYIFLIALWFAFLVPDLAQAAARFAVCTTTCTWNNDGITTGIMWSTSSGGATGASAPVAGDTVTLDAATCVGGTTCTITTFSGTISATSISFGSCTASTTGCIVNASANNTNFTLSTGAATAFSASGTGTRKWTGGTGTYTLTSTNTNGCFDHSTTTNDQGSTYSGATFVCTVTASNTWTWGGGAFSFGPTTINGNSSFGGLFMTGANTWSSLTLNSPNVASFASTQTISGALTLNGSSSSSLVLITGSNLDTVATISLGAASIGTWAGLRTITTSGASKLDVTNCANYGRVTLANSGTCTVPSVGGGGGRIIGG